jgi:signal transduction histidine kinase
VKIELEFGPQDVVLQVKDNGCGFTPENGAGSKEGRFGLLGMSERAKRLNGRISLTSSPGGGTSVRVEIPSTPPPQTGPFVSTGASHLT